MNVQSYTPTSAGQTDKTAGKISLIGLKLNEMVNGALAPKDPD